VIAGIDPGTTTAIAVIDMSGRLLSLQSRKNMRRADMNRHITRLGTPVMIATDRNPAPSLAEKLASTFSARLVVPEENMSKRDKNRLARDMLSSDQAVLLKGRPNQHEKDALAAAFFAFNSVKSTMARVDQRLKALGRSDNQDLKNFVRTRVILHNDHVKRAVGKFPGLDDKGSGTSSARS
jgi:predicted RNase H-like nuclease (RuvC/YqgF family)